MKACVVLFLLLPSLAVANTARISTWNFDGFHQIPHAKPVNFIGGIKKPDAALLVLPELSTLSNGQAIDTKKESKRGQFEHLIIVMPPLTVGLRSKLC